MSAPDVLDSYRFNEREREALATLPKWDGAPMGDGIAAKHDALIQRYATLRAEYQRLLSEYDLAPPVWS